jgi:hypothetical protein
MWRKWLENRVPGAGLKKNGERNTVELEIRKGGG